MEPMVCIAMLEQVYTDAVLLVDVMRMKQHAISSCSHMDS